MASMVFGGERPQQEMSQKSRLHETFFSLKNTDERPNSVMTEFMDTDWDQASVDIVSEIEDDENSPRHSLNSSGQQSVTTISSYDEVHTPRSSRNRSLMGFHDMQQVEGPRGPHLFRTSQNSSNSVDYKDVLTLSPLTPKVPRPLEADFRFTLAEEPVPALPQQAEILPIEYTAAELDTGRLASWSPRQVAQWMLNAGVEEAVADKFVENDINGSILMTLKFEDLKELNIPSFGVRTKAWEQIHLLRGSRSGSPRPPTPIEDVPSREVKKELKSSTGSIKRKKSKRSNKHKASHEDLISPLESVSIVGIEQLMPKPHHCSKGENCSKFRRNQRMMEAFKKDHPFVDVEGGTIMIAGDPGNPETAESIPLSACDTVSVSRLHSRRERKPEGQHHQYQGMAEQPMQEQPQLQYPAEQYIMLEPQQYLRPEVPHQHRYQQAAAAAQFETEMRPISDAVPSVVASSDVMGPGSLPPLQYILQEAALQNLQVRDPQDNVRQFLDFQHQHSIATNEVPPTPPFEMGAGAQPVATPPAHHGLRRLPRLSIPVQAPARSSAAGSCAGSLAGGNMANTVQPFVPYRMDKADPISPDLATPTAPYRFGTPFSEMDVPVTAIPVGPIARDLSQSVPPNMNFHTPTMLVPHNNRSASRVYSRRPSVPVLPALDENAATPRASRAPSSIAATLAAASQSTTALPLAIPAPPASTMGGAKPVAAAQPQQQQQQPRAVGAVAASRPLQPPPRAAYPWSSGRQPAHACDDGTTYEGPMRKRKTRMLRHEWHEAYFSLKGTRLAMHPDNHNIGRTLEYVDIDDYAIACSSLGSSKLNAAFRAVNFALRGDKAERRSDDQAGAFSFQLIPQEKAGGGGARLRKRESNMAAVFGKAPSSHHHNNSQDSAASLTSANSSLPSASVSSASATSAVTTPASSLNSAAPSEGTNATGKTHHFAVRSRDERIDWMRELMLAKALKQKTEGFEVSVNGNMI